MIEQGREPLVDPALLEVVHLRAGLLAFFFQFLLLLGLFFLMSLYLTVALGLSAIATGVRLMPMSIMLLLAAVGIPKLLPNVSPRSCGRVGFLSLAVGLVLLVALLDVGTGRRDRHLAAHARRVRRRGAGLAVGCGDGGRGVRRTQR